VQKSKGDQEIRIATGTLLGFDDGGPPQKNLGEGGNVAIVLRTGETAVPGVPQSPDRLPAFGPTGRGGCRLLQRAGHKFLETDCGRGGAMTWDRQKASEEGAGRSPRTGGPSSGLFHRGRGNVWGPGEFCGFSIGAFEAGIIVVIGRAAACFRGAKVRRLRGGAERSLGTIWNRAGGAASDALAGHGGPGKNLAGRAGACGGDVLPRSGTKNRGGPGSFKFYQGGRKERSWGRLGRRKSAGN